VDALRAFYSDAQIVEITHVVANYNSVNRWTDGLGLPQETERVFDDPQSVIAVGTQSLVAPAGEVPRPPLCDVEEARAALAEARLRRPRAELPDELPAALGEFIELPRHWLQMISYFPTLAQTQATAARSIANDGTLPLSLKAEAAWLTARHNRAWYALDHACKQLRGIGWTDDEIFQLDDPATCPKLNDAERGALELVRKLTVAPQFITDADIERLQGPWSDQQIAELVFVTCAANQFDRFTEALGLPLDQ
jgi:alkylhydroperoxidase family enzyme